MSRSLLSFPLLNTPVFLFRSHISVKINTVFKPTALSASSIEFMKELPMPVGINANGNQSKTNYNSLNKGFSLITRLRV